MARRFSRLPPLNTLLVFEAAGRHLNFSSAAAELGMTQPAVSHQVSSLEGQLGMPLFRRLHRGVVLTAAGAQLLDAVSEGLTTMQDAASALRRRTGPKILHVFTDYGFAAWWLIPRLGRWSERVPEVEVQLVTAQRQVDLRQAEADVAVWFGDGSWRGRRIVRSAVPNLPAATRSRERRPCASSGCCTLRKSIRRCGCPGRTGSQPKACQRASGLTI
jgi:DNA-binding transcriptional LysR family regulator